MRESGGSDTDTGDGGRLPVQPPKPGTAMSIVVLVVGLGIVGIGAYTYVADSASLDNNVEVTAEVTDTTVEERTASRDVTVYVPVITFQYQFRGTSYTSDRIYPGNAQPRYEEQAAAQSQLAEYPVGQSVTAYVDPDRPGAAFLEDSRSGLSTGALIVGVLISLIAAIGLYQARAEARARDLLS